jgi:hypothetical protein
MDADRFDALIRSLPLAAPRRTALGALGGGLTALLTRVGIDDTEAKNGKKKKKKKKKCKGGKKKCGKKCIPKSQCCNDANCGEDQQCCNGECIDAFFCCTVSDCLSDFYTCDAGLCTCPTASEIPCGSDFCCDPATQVCKANENLSECQDGSCPDTDYCDDPNIYFCGGPGDCSCVTSVDNETVCSDLFGECFACTTDAECTAELGEAAVCLDLSGQFCGACDTDVTTACVFASCLGNSSMRAAGHAHGKKLRTFMR